MLRNDKQQKSNLFINYTLASGANQTITPLGLTEFSLHCQSHIEVFLNNLSSILSKNASLKNKQRRIEKLFNAYFLDKKSRKYTVNRVLASAILLEYEDILREFRLRYDTYVNNMRPQFEEFDVFKIISCDEFFIFICLVLFSDKNFLEKNSIMYTTFKSTILEKFLQFYDTVFRIEVIGDQFYNWFTTRAYETAEQKNSNIDISTLCALLSGKMRDRSAIDKHPPRFLKTRHSIDWSFSLLDLLNIYLKRSVTRGNKLFKEFSKVFNQYFSMFVSNTLVSILTTYVSDNLSLLLNLRVFNVLREKSFKRNLDFLCITDINKFTSLSSLFLSVLSLPMIFKPVRWDYSGNGGGYLLNKTINQVALVKPLSEGMSSFKLTKQIINTINILQEKEYVVDSDALLLFESSFFREKLGVLELGILYKKYLNAISVNNEYVSACTKVDLTSYYNEVNGLDLSGPNLTEKKATLRSKYGLGSKFFELKQRLKEHTVLYLKNLQLYLDWLFNVFYARLLNGYTLYTVTYLDFCGRMFAVGRLTRAAGVFRYLLKPKPRLNDYFTYKSKNYLDWLKVSIMDSINFKAKTTQSYVGNFDSLFGIFGGRLGDLSNKGILFFDRIFTEVGFLDSFVDSLQMSSELDRSEKSTLHWLYSRILSNLKYTKFFNCFFGLRDYLFYLKDPEYKSTYQISVGQASSEFMIYSFLNKDPLILKLTSAVTTRKDDLCSHFTKQLASTLQDRGSYVLKTLDDETKIKLVEYMKRREFGKAIIMASFYNRQQTGIVLTLVNILRDLNLDLKFVSDLANYIHHFFRKFCPYTLNYQDKLVQITKSCLGPKQYGICMRTLDGGLLSYKYEASCSEVKPQKLSQKQYTSLPSNFIHQLGGSICRLAVKSFYDEMGFIPEPLHDSFKLPIKYLDSFIALVKYLYLVFFWPFDTDTVVCYKEICPDTLQEVLRINRISELSITQPPPTLVRLTQVNEFKQSLNSAFYVDNKDLFKYISPVLYFSFLSCSVLSKDCDTIKAFNSIGLPESFKHGFFTRYPMDKTVSNVLRSKYMFYIVCVG